jgi:cytochrome P450
MDLIVYRLIQERRTNKKDFGDLLSMLLLAEDADNPGQHLSDVEVRDEAMTLIFSGHETTSNALSWTWWLLAQNPEAEALLHDELATVLGNRLPTFADLPRLVYTDCLLRESMRLYPPVWAARRVAIVDHEIGGYQIDRNTQVLISQWVTHRDSRLFSEPDRFRPERWSPAFRESLPKFAYFPFGGGPRLCIGEGFAWMEVSLLIATLAQRWRFRLTSETNAVPQPGITLRPRGQLKLRLERRK